MLPLRPRPSQRVIRADGVVVRLVFRTASPDRQRYGLVSSVRVLDGDHVHQHPAVAPTRCRRLPPLHRRPC
eukprot:2428309-Pleurochrysis_carterae.AAC.1